MGAAQMMVVRGGRPCSVSMARSAGGWAGAAFRSVLAGQHVAEAREQLPGWSLEGGC
jgi:hypothetical protein